MTNDDQVADYQSRLAATASSWAELARDCDELRAKWKAAEAEAIEWAVKGDQLRAKNERLRAALVEITELELEGDASLDDAIRIADEALNP